MLQPLGWVALKSAPARFVFRIAAVKRSVFLAMGCNSL
jgi:hypothetical protein